MKDRLKTCLLCGGELPQPFFSLPGMPSCAQHIPLADELKDDVGIDLNLRQCPLCGLVQLDCPPVSYYRDVIRAGGGTSTMRELRTRQYAHFIELCGLGGKRIVEIGCGQGEFLEMLEGFPVHGFGIENDPSLVAAAVAKGLSVREDFASASGHVLADGPFDAFMQFNFIEHQPDPNAMVACIRENLVEGGCGLVTAPSFEYIRNDCVYEIMRDHIAYYTERTLRFLFEKNGFDILESGVVNRDTLYAIVRMQERFDAVSFGNNRADIKRQLDAFVGERLALGHRLAFWGASHQCFTAAAFLADSAAIACIVDSAAFKQGRYSPVSHIPIVSPERLFAAPPDDLLILAPGYTDEIRKLVAERCGGKVSVFALRSGRIEVCP